MKRLKSILTVLLIFGCGLIVGGILAAGATYHDLVNKIYRDGPVNSRKVLLQRAKHDLNLDEDQAHQFWLILTDTGGELQKALAPVYPQLQSVFARSEMRLREVLNEGQKAKFDSFVKTTRARWGAAIQAQDQEVQQ
jgi:hypothetical protein